MNAKESSATLILFAPGAFMTTMPRCVAFVESYRKTPGIVRAATAAEVPEDLAASLRRFLAERR